MDKMSQFKVTRPRNAEKETENIVYHNFWIKSYMKCKLGKKYKEHIQNH